MIWCVVGIIIWIFMSQFIAYLLVGGRDEDALLNMWWAVFIIPPVALVYAPVWVLAKLIKIVLGDTSPVEVDDLI